MHTLSGFPLSKGRFSDRVERGDSYKGPYGSAGVFLCETEDTKTPAAQNQNEKWGDKMAEPDVEWLKRMKTRVAEEVSRKELEALEYWKGEVEKSLAKRNAGLAALEFEIQNVIQRMQNRIKILKNTLPRH